MRRMSTHHLIPKSRGGKTERTNELRLWRDRHDLFHKLFGNRTLPEIIVLLQRVQRAKRGKR
jgi:hypothetical protein